MRKFVVSEARMLIAQAAVLVTQGCRASQPLEVGCTILLVLSCVCRPLCSA